MLGAFKMCSIPWVSPCIHSLFPRPRSCPCPPCPVLIATTIPSNLARRCSHFNIGQHFLPFFVAFFLCLFLKPQHRSSVAYNSTACSDACMCRFHEKNPAYACSRSQPGVKPVLIRWICLCKEVLCAICLVFRGFASAVSALLPCRLADHQAVPILTHWVGNACVQRVVLLQQQ